jgi:hypothetical protein
MYSVLNSRRDKALALKKEREAAQEPYEFEPESATAFFDE